MAHESFQFGLHNPKLCVFLALFDGNTIRIGTNITNLAREYSNDIFWPAIKSELCIPALGHCMTSIVTSDKYKNASKKLVWQSRFQRDLWH